MLPLLHSVAQLSELHQAGSWDALLLVCPTDLTGLSAQLREELSAARELDERLKPVNRLDQETSGLIVLARGARNLRMMSTSGRT